MFVIQRLYAGNKYLVGLAINNWSNDISNAFKFDSHLEAKIFAKHLHNVRIINLETKGNYHD